MIAAVCLLLSGCYIAPAKEYCANTAPILVGKLDKLTPETVKQIKDHNQKGEQVCGWRKNAG